LTVTGTRLYFAPEVINGEPPSEANDATWQERWRPTHGGFNGDTTNGWFITENNPTKMDDNWGYPYFRKPHTWGVESGEFIASR